MVETKRGVNHREAIKLTLATTMVLAGCGKAARESGGSTRAIANLGTVLEASDSGTNTLSLVSLRNKASGFEWLASEQAFSPLAATGSFEAAVAHFDGQLGAEARAILMSLSAMPQLPEQGNDEDPA